jgi:ubiquitin carboxyl-terminal hydrolase 14
VTSDLKAKLQPLQEKFIEVENRRAERRKIRKQKVVTAITTVKASDSETMETELNGSSDAAEKVLLPEELEDESKYRERELAELEALINPDIKEDVGASATGLYELVGEYHALSSPRFFLSHTTVHVQPS